MKRAQPKPEAPPEPEPVSVSVDPAIAATGSETFDDGKRLGLFSEKAEKPGATETSGKPSTNPVLLSYPFVKLFKLADKIRHTEGVLTTPDWPQPHGIWELSDDEKEYFTALAEELMRMLKDVKYIRLAIIMGGIVVMVMGKATLDVDYHRQNPNLQPPKKGAENPTSTTGRKGARK